MDFSRRSRATALASARGTTSRWAMGTASNGGANSSRCSRPLATTTSSASSTKTRCCLRSRASRSRSPSCATSSSSCRAHATPHNRSVISKSPARSVAIFDLGGVVREWNPRHLYRKLFDGDDAAMEDFLANVCTTEWNEQQDAGRTFAEGVRELLPRHADKRELIEAFGARFAEMIPGAIDGSVEILRELKAHGLP